MAIDDNPIEVLRRHFELEDIYKSPVSEAVLKITNELAKLVTLPSPLKAILETVNETIRTDSVERMAIMLKTVADEVVKYDNDIRQLRQSLSGQQRKAREEQEAGLLVDGARKASSTRSIARVHRIGLILAHSISSSAIPDEDEIEEMMRIATDLSDIDVTYLRNLVNIQARSFLCRLLSGKKENISQKMVPEIIPARTFRKIELASSRVTKCISLLPMHIFRG